MRQVEHVRQVDVCAVGSSSGDEDPAPSRPYDPQRVRAFRREERALRRTSGVADVTAIDAETVV